MSSRANGHRRRDTGRSPSPDRREPFSPPCVSLDLEVGRKDRRIHAFAAVRPDSGQRLVFNGRNLARALAELDDFADGAEFVLGHNLIFFDLPHLAAAGSGLRLLELPAVDTLWLNPLAFPRNPYHHLVKHYQDGQLKRGRVNDPELDARLALDVFRDQRQALGQASPGLLIAWHWLATSGKHEAGFDIFFSGLRGSPRPTDAEARTAIESRLTDNACLTCTRAVLVDATRGGWDLAYALAWLSVSGGNSVMPPWVRHQFPEAGLLVRRLRDTACNDPGCEWCRVRHNARWELTRWFGFDGFRPAPEGKDGRPMQQSIVESALAGRHVLGILPTGTGKSLCYQIPALSRYDKTGALTVVISPLVALMADQVAGLEAHNIGSCVAINGLLSIPERADALDRIRLGDAGLVLVSPEQLRSRSFRRVLDQREIGAWVLDEAHCLSRWGHDFRPDYRYVGRFIREKAGQDPIPSLLCLTATAKPDVVEDIARHFRNELGIELEVFDGGARRTNLEFVVVQTTGGEKLAHIHQVLESDLPPGTPGGAIVYCATRRRSEEVAEFLQLKKVAADHFHAGLPPETKKSVQQRFIGGELRVIAATNAFGMGIDKPDVRLVIHADIPGSLENYLQEAGRAGRDRQKARCVLLYSTDDVERQFGMSARSRLTRREIHGILRALRNLDRKKRLGGEVVATAGEILLEDDERTFEQDSATDDTRVRTAIAWLEEAVLLTREENEVQVFPASLQVRIGGRSARQAGRKDHHERLPPAVAGHRRSADRRRPGRNRLHRRADERVRPWLRGCARRPLRPRTPRNREERHVAHRLRPRRSGAELPATARGGGCARDRPRRAPARGGPGHGQGRRLHPSPAGRIAGPARCGAGRPPSGAALAHPARPRRRRPRRGWHVRQHRGPEARAETVLVTLRREWCDLEETASRRRAGARRLLEHLLATLPTGSRGTDLLAETTLGKLLEALNSDLDLKARIKSPRSSSTGPSSGCTSRRSSASTRGSPCFAPP